MMICTANTKNIRITLVHQAVIIWEIGDVCYTMVTILSKRQIMQNQSLSPQPVASQSSPQTVNNSPDKQKVSLNPFTHFKQGAGSLVKSNLSASLVAILVSSVVGVVIAIGFLYATFVSSSSLIFGSSPFAGSGNLGSSFFKTVAIFIGVAILASCISGYFGSVVNRVIITGSRGQKESVGHAFSFVLSRLPKIILTYLFIFAVFIAGVVVITIAGSVAPILALLLGLAGIIALIVFALKISYVPLVLVDDEDPGPPMATIRRSAALWKNSDWAIVIYVVVCVVIYFIFSLLLASNTPPTSSSLSAYNQSGFNLQPTSAFTFSMGSVLLSSFVSTAFSALVYCGVASIYNDARKLIGGHKPSSTSSAAPTPTPPHG